MKHDCNDYKQWRFNFIAENGSALGMYQCAKCKLIFIGDYAGFSYEKL